jgi:hypothetical protein
MGQDRAIVRRAEVTDLANIEAVARTTWPLAYAGVIPVEVQRRLLDSWYSPGAFTRALGAQESVLFVAEWDRSISSDANRAFAHAIGASRNVVRQAFAPSITHDVAIVGAMRVRRNPAAA